MDSDDPLGTFVEDNGDFQTRSASIDEVTPPTQSLPAGYSAVNWQSNVVVFPPAFDTFSPLNVGFRLDNSILPSGVDHTNLALFRNGTLVPACSSIGADPDPCVHARVSLGGGDILVAALTTEMSAWNFGAPTGAIFVNKDTVPNDPQNFSFTAAGLAPASFTLDDDSDGTFSNSQTFTGVAAGSGYSVSETVPSGWIQESATCSDGSPVSNINVSAGETITCTFRNSRPYEKPISASPLRIPLVAAFGGCTSANSTHGAPLDFPSCNPPSPSSGTVKTGTGSIGQAWIIVCNTGTASPSCNESAGGFTSSLQPDFRIFGANRDTQCRLTGTPSGCSAGSDYNPNGATGPYTTTCTTAATCGNDGRPAPLCAPGVGSSTACFAGSDVTLVQGLGDPSNVTVDPSTQCGTDASCLSFASRFVGHGLRVTDRHNCEESLPAGDPNDCPASASTSTRAATLVDIQFPVPLDCLGTASAALGSTCGVNTTANALVPGFVLAGKQGVVELGEITLRDSGPDGTRGNTDDERFATQGIFLP